MNPTIEDSDPGETSDMECPAPTFGAENSLAVAKHETAPSAAFLPSRRRSLVTRSELERSLRRPSTMEDRIDMDDGGASSYSDAHQSPPRHNRAAAQPRRSRPGRRGSMLSNFSIDSIASRVEAALFDPQTRRRSVHSQITEDEVDRLLGSQENPGDDGNDDDDDDDASARPSRRSVDLAPPRQGRRLSWVPSMVSYLADDDEAINREEEEGHDDEADNYHSASFKKCNARQYLAVLAVAGACMATSFAAGYLYASNSSIHDTHSVDTSEHLKYEPQEPTEYHVSGALEDILQHTQVAYDNDRLPSDDIFNANSRESKVIQVMVRCDEPEGCLEAMKKSSSVHVAPTQDMSRLSLNVHPEDFDDLRSVHGLHLDVDHIIEAVEDDVEDTNGENIDLADLIRQQNGGGSVRGSRPHRRAEQYVSEGFQMIQAIMDDGSPFPPGPHRKRICIPDTGTCKSHPDLIGSHDLDGIDLVMDDGNTVLRWDEDKEGHGCHSTGLIGALDNEFGYVGIGGSDVFITRALQDDRRATVSQMMAALDQCIDAGASIIALSFGCTGCRDAMYEPYFRSLADKGIMLVAASGNIGGGDQNGMFYPASFPGSVISVGAVNSDESVWYKSAVNNQVEFCAHGQNVISTGLSLDFVRKSGTSMSTPQVAAVAANLWSHYPRCSATQIRSVLAATAKSISGSLERCTQECGFGIPQLQDAYSLLDSTKSIPGVSQDYDCDVGGMILSSTASVCDCIDSNGDPSKCIDPNTSGPAEPTLPECKDKKMARFRINVSRERNANKRDLQTARQKRRNRSRGCKYIRQKKSRAQFWCQINQDVRKSCQGSCSKLAGIVYNSCSA